ncbi:MAG: hypothetical protein WC346_03050 [Methanogenium sp.]|jgi:hypothetical protein
MSWTDFKAVETFCKLRDEFNIKYYIETGTFRAQGARVMSSFFDEVFTCEISLNYYIQAKKNIKDIPNIRVFLEDSPTFLKILSRVFYDPAFYYLDAHFYDPNLPKEERFTVKKELEAIKPSKNCVIAIHDFDTRNGLGHLVYDGIPLDFEVVKEGLRKINPDFVFYTNYKDACKIVTKEDITTGKLPHLQLTLDMEDSLNFIWSDPFKTYRGILYCVPKELDLTKYELHKVDWK